MLDLGGIFFYLVTANPVVPSDANGLEALIPRMVDVDEEDVTLLT